MILTTFAILAFILLFIIALVINLRTWQRRNAPNCGHKGVKQYMSEERAWLCYDCYQEWVYDKIGIGRCR